MARHFEFERPFPRMQIPEGRFARPERLGTLITRQVAAIGGRRRDSSARVPKLFPLLSLICLRLVFVRARSCRAVPSFEQFPEFERRDGARRDAIS